MDQVDARARDQVGHHALVGRDALVERALGRHGVVPAHGADALEQRLADQTLVGVIVVGRDVPLVTDVDVDDGPVDAPGVRSRQDLVALPRRRTAGEHEREARTGARGEGLQDRVAECARDVVDQGEHAAR